MRISILAILTLFLNIAELKAKNKIFDFDPILPNEFISVYDTACFYINQDNYEMSFEYLNKFKYAPQFNDDIYIRAAAHLMEGEIYRKLLIWDKAEYHFLVCRDLFEKTNQKQLQFTMSYFLASVMESSNSHYDKMLSYSLVALNQAIALNDTFYIARSYDAVGCSYARNQQYDKAIEYSTKAVSLMGNKGSKNFVPNIYTNLAEHYMIKENYIMANQYICKSIDFFGDNSPKGWVNNAYRIGGTIFLKLGQKDKAMKYLNMALNYCRKNVNNPHFATKTFDLVVNQYMSEGKYKEAVLLQKEYSRLKDSASKKELIVRLAHNQLLIDVNNKEKEREKLLNSLVFEQKMRRFTLVIAVLLAVFLLSLFFLYWEKSSFNKKLETEVELKTETLTQKNKELERFTFIASHDLRTPLRNIVSFSTLLNRRLKNINDPDAAQYLDFIKSYANHMNQIIDDIQDFSKIGKEDNENIEIVDLNEIKEEVLSVLKDKIHQRNASIDTEGLLPKVKADRKNVLHLMQNLVENALIYNENEKPIIRIGVRNDEKGFKNIYVEDNGIGIDEQHLNKVFEMFTRLHSIEKYPGTGLGLAICKKIVSQYGGRIWINSKKKEGTIVNFLLPAA